VDFDTTLRLENGRYGHALIQSDTSVRVYTTADTDTSTPCIGVPATCNIRPARSLRERSLCAMGGTCWPLATNQLAWSVSFKTGSFTGKLAWLTVDCCYHILLLGCGVVCRWWPQPSTAPSWCHREAGIRLQSPSSHPSNPLPYCGRSYGAGAKRVMEDDCPLIVLCSATC